MKIDKSSQLVEEYLLYLTTIKGRSLNTVIEYRIDLTLFFAWLSKQRTLYVATHDLSFVNIDFIQSISISDMYGFQHIARMNVSRQQGLGHEKLCPYDNSGVICTAKHIYLNATSLNSLKHQSDRKGLRNI